MRNQFIPTTIVDGFFEEPDLWREFALSCEYKNSSNNRYPGVRSDPLYELNTVAFETLSKKFFSLFYNLEKEHINWKLNAFFQRIPKNLKDGWVHYDHHLISGIIYLTPNINMESGTSIFTENKICTPINTEWKRIDYSGGDADKYREENNKQFTEVIKVNNLYNRMVAFDCNIAHKANFAASEEERLTLVFFVEQLITEHTPIQRMHRRVF